MTVDFSEDDLVFQPVMDEDIKLRFNPVSGEFIMSVADVQYYETYTLSNDELHSLYAKVRIAIENRL